MELDEVKLSRLGEMDTGTPIGTIPKQRISGPSAYPRVFPSSAAMLLDPAQGDKEGEPLKVIESRTFSGRL